MLVFGGVWGFFNRRVVHGVSEDVFIFGVGCPNLDPMFLPWTFQRKITENPRGEKYIWILVKHAIHIHGKTIGESNEEDIVGITNFLSVGVDVQKT